MPRSRNIAYSALQTLNHNPNLQMGFDPSTIIQSAEAALALPNVEALIEQGVIDLLNEIDTYTGLDLLGLANALKTTFPGEDLLLAWLNSNPLSFLSPILSVLEGGSPLDSLSELQQEFVTYLLNTLSVAQNAQNVANGLNALLSNAINLLTGWAESIVSTVLGPLENVLPWTTPFIIGTQTDLTDLATYLTTLAPQAQVQQLQDTLYNGLLGNLGPAFIQGTTQAQLAAAIQQVTNTANSATTIAQQAWNYVLNFVSQTSNFLIPNTSIGGSLGATAVGLPSLGGQVQGLIDGAVQGFTQDPALAGSSIAQLANMAGGLANLLGFNPGSSGVIPGSTADLTQTNNAFIANQSVSKVLSAAIDTTADATFPINMLFNQSTLPTVAVTQTASLIGFITTPHGGMKESIQWIGENTTNVTGMYFNVYSYNPVNNQITWMYTSPNIVGLVESTLSFNVYDLPISAFFNSSQGNIFAVEMCITGTGTYLVAGLTNNAALVHPTAQPATIGATRGSSTPIFDSYTKGFAGIATTGTQTWTHNVGNNPAEYIFALLSAYESSGSIAAPTCNGTAMTLLTSNSEAANITYLYGSPAPASGPAAMAWDITAGTWYVTAMDSISYYNAASLGTPANTVGVFSGVFPGNAIQSIAAAANEVVLQAFGIASIATAGPTVLVQSPADYAASTGANLHGVHQSPISTALASGLYESLVIGDAPGATSVQFTVACPPTPSITVGDCLTYYVGVGVPVIGTACAPPETLNPVFSNSNLTPYFALGGSAGQTDYIPDPTTFAGSGSYHVPQWATLFDIVGFGGGGGGGGGGYTAYGNGGGCGGHFAITVTAAQLEGFTTLNVNVGGGGGGGGGLDNGGNGAGTSVTLPNGTVLAACGGGGGGGSGGNGLYGQGEPSFTYNGNPYYGGGGGPGFQDGGGQPGGGGAGGDTYGLEGNPYLGGSGGPGAVFILAYT
jgi:hypothetical protein